MIFYTHGNINILFQNANTELKNLCDWFSANKLSLNNDKTKYAFFHKPIISDYIPLKLAPLYINNKIIKRSEHIRFLGILLTLLVPGGGGGGGADSAWIVSLS